MASLSGTRGPASPSDARVIATNGRAYAVIWKPDPDDGMGLWESNVRYGGLERRPATSFEDYAARMESPENFPNVTLVQPKTKWACYYPLIAWPGCRVRRREEGQFYDGTPYRSYFERQHINSRQAAHVSNLALYRRLADIFETVEPHPKNYSTHGHALRHLLILACTEVESAWRSIMTANGYLPQTKGKPTAFTTRDYVKLKPVLRLGEWKVTLESYPFGGLYRPFEAWDDASPTKSLAWYDAYNAVKHDRAGELPRASLENVLNAMAAVAIMGWASFGEKVIGIEGVPHTAVFMPFHRPKWSPDEVYYGPEDDSKNSGQWWASSFKFPGGLTAEQLRTAMTPGGDAPEPDD